MSTDVLEDTQPIWKPPADVKQRVICAAIMNSMGSIICGPRHYDEIMRKQISKSKENWDHTLVRQGFVDQWGAWLDRKTAFTIAKENGQIARTVGTEDSQTLFSENLY